MFHSVLFIYLIKTVENDCFHLKSYSIREKIQEVLEAVIPNENYNTLVKKFDSVKFSSIIGETIFSATIRIHIREEETLRQFLNDFSENPIQK